MRTSLLCALSLALALSTSACAIQGGGFVTHRERVRSGAALQARIRSAREPGPFVGVEVAAGIGDNPGGVRIKSGTALLGYDGRRNLFGARRLGAEIATATAYGRPIGPALEKAAYFAGLRGGLSYRVGSLEDAEPSFAVLLTTFDLVLDAQAGFWWTSRFASTYDDVFGWRVGLNIRFGIETDLILNRR